MSGSLYVKLPNDIETNKAVLNILNNYNKCFVYAVNVAFFNPIENPARISSNPPYNALLSVWVFQGKEYIKV